MFYATLTHYWLHVLLPCILHPPPSLLSQNQAQITSLLSSTGDTSCSCKHVCSLFQMLCSCLTYTVHINCTRDLLLFSTLPTRGNWVSVKWLTQDGQESQEVSWPLGLELWTTTAGALQLSSNQPHTVARGFFLNYYHQDSLSSSTQLSLQASSSGIQSSSSNRKLLPLLWEAAPPHLYWNLFPLVCFAVILIGAVIHLKLWLCLV